MFNSIPSNSLSSVFPDVKISDNVSIGSGVQIGSGTQISAGVRIYPGTKIGKNVVVLENTVIGRPTILPPTSTVKRTISQSGTPTSIGDNSVIGGCVVIYEAVQIGNRNIICDLSSIREGCKLADDILIGRSVMLQVNTVIGARTKIMDTCHLGDMVVEEDVFLSTHVCTAAENSIGRADVVGKWGGPYIARGAYVGVNATLLPGVRIGEDSVVAASATVTKDVTPGTLVMGTPARFVRNVEPRAKE